MSGLRKATLAASTAAAVALVAAAAASASNAASYRAQVNGICRSYTPKFKKLESDMAAAKRAGDGHRYGYDVGFILALTYKQGIRIEKTPVPPDARAAMAAPLRLLHSADLRLATTLQDAIKGDQKAFAADAAKLAKVSAPLNRAFDAAGLRDCGSNQQ